MRQIAGTFAQLEKARLVAKLKAARDRKREACGKCEGRKGYAEAVPDTVAMAKQFQADGLSYRKIAAELAARGHLTGSGQCRMWRLRYRRCLADNGATRSKAYRDRKTRQFLAPPLAEKK